MDNLRGIALMVLAMACFACADLFIKLGARSMSAAELMFFSSLLGAAVFAALAILRRERIVSPLFLHRHVLLRNGFEIVGTACIISALAAAPLSLVTSITQANPLVVTAGAALFLGERVGPRRWIAVGVGFAGVLLILQPGRAPLDAGALYSLGALFGLSGRDVVTRAIPRAASTLQLSAWGLGVLVPVAALLALAGTGLGLPDGREALLLAAMTATIVVAYAAITGAMRVGEISAVTPFRYTRLIFAMAIAMSVFGERPGALTFLGAAIVIGSGLFVLLRERRNN